MRTPHPDAPSWQALNRLLEQALALPEADRAAWIDSLDDADREHRGVLRALVARATADTDSFMRVPVVLGGDAASDAVDAPGARVGPWRLLRELGAGGMSTVWLAERADGTLAREVALKLPRHAWAHGLAQRMARERDILAALEHPGIARLYDAGVTAEGRPWLAMERVDGVPIDVFARERQLGVPAILGLLLQVADALSHAHGRLIVHRDLKPANILVTAAGEVRLLDFGVAKLLEDDTPAAGLTQQLGRAVTPDYASPEQVSLRPVTVATDVYSLGVVAYELLTGERPYRVGRPGAAALEEAILAAEVPAASQRAAGDRALAKALRGDIDTILAKALRKDPARRYASIESFAADLRRHLGGEPIHAQPQRTRVRVAKFVRRHRLPLGAAVAVLASLIGGLGAALWQAHEARQQGALAQARLEQAQTAYDFAERLITEGLQQGETLTIEQFVQRAEQMAERDFGREPARRVHAIDAVADWFIAYGNYERAEALLDRTIAALPPGIEPERRHGLACKRARAHANLGRWDEALAALEASARALRRDSRDRATLAYCQQSRAFVAWHLNDAPGALAAALEAQREFDAAGRHAPHERAMQVALLAHAYTLNGRPREAQQRYDEAVALLAAAGREESPVALTVYNNRALAWNSAGRPAAALDELDRADAIAARRSPGGRLPGYLHANRGQALRLLGRDAEALAVYGRLVADARADPNPSYEVIGLAGQALALPPLGRTEEARALIDRAESVRRRHALHEDGSPVRTLRLAQALVHRSAGQWREADEILATLQQRDAQLGLRVGQGAVVALARAEIAIEERRFDDARQQLEAAQAAADAARGDFDDSVHTQRARALAARLPGARLTTTRPPAAPPPRPGTA